MNAVFGAPINLPANQYKPLAGIKIGSPNEMKLVKNILVRVANLPGGIAHLITGPPMSERERYNQTVAEARLGILRVLPALGSGFVRQPQLIISSSG